MNVIKKYTWLLQVLQKSGGLTLAEIERLWEDTDISYGNPLNRRTFQRWRNEIEDIFSISIACNTARGYKYYIETNNNEQVTDWLVHTLTVANLLDEYKNQSTRILLEDVPSGEEHLETILEAIKYNKQLMVTYHNFRSAEANPPALVNPLCVKLSDRRWYVVVDFAEKDGYRRVMALDRIERMTMSGTKFTQPIDFDAEGFFADSYGVTVMPEKPTERVVLKVPSSSVPYLRALPFHRSQREIRPEGDSVYMEYRLKITDELAFALLRHAVRCEIVQPAELREKVTGLAKQILDTHNV